MCQFSGKTDNFDFFDKNLPKNGFWGLNFKKLSAGFESVSPKFPNVPIFSQNKQI